jgi:hypothetical protein
MAVPTAIFPMNVQPVKRPHWANGVVYLSATTWRVGLDEPARTVAGR